MNQNRKINIGSAAKFIFKRPHNPNFEVISTIPLIWHIAKFYFFKITDYLWDTGHTTVEDVKKIKSASQDKKTIAKIHFLLGIEAIRNNKLFDARLRFWLTDKFIPGSKTTLYYKAFVSYLQGNIVDSIANLEQIKNTPKYKTKRIQNLISKINKTNRDVLSKLNVTL